MNKIHWSRRHAANQPTKRKTRAYDRRNSIAAGVILSAPQQHSRFQIDWAQRFMRRREVEWEDN